MVPMQQWHERDALGSCLIPPEDAVSNKRIRTLEAQVTRCMLCPHPPPNRVHRENGEKVGDIACILN